MSDTSQHGTTVSEHTLKKPHIQVSTWASSNKEDPNGLPVSDKHHQKHHTTHLYGAAAQGAGGQEQWRYYTS